MLLDSLGSSLGRALGGIERIVGVGGIGEVVRWDWWD